MNFELFKLVLLLPYYILLNIILRVKSESEQHEGICNYITKKICGLRYQAFISYYSIEEISTNKHIDFQSESFRFYMTQLMLDSNHKHTPILVAYKAGYRFSENEIKYTIERIFKAPNIMGHHDKKVQISSELKKTLKLIINTLPENKDLKTLGWMSTISPLTELVNEAFITLFTRAISNSNDNNLLKFIAAIEENQINISCKEIKDIIRFYKEDLSHNFLLSAFGLSIPDGARSFAQNLNIRDIKNLSILNKSHHDIKSGIKNTESAKILIEREKTIIGRELSDLSR